MGRNSSVSFFPEYSVEAALVNESYLWLVEYLGSVLNTSARAVPPYCR